MGDRRHFETAGHRRLQNGYSRYTGERRLSAAAAGNVFLPTDGTLLAAVSFDQTGSTRIGGYLLNHGFMRPGLVTMIAAIPIAWALSAVVPL